MGVTAGLWILAAVWIGKVFDASMLQWVRKAVYASGRTAKNSMEQEPAKLREEALETMLIVFSAATAVLAIVGVLLIVRATRGGVRALAAVALGFALASVALHAWYTAIYVEFQANRAASDEAVTQLLRKASWVAYVRNIADMLALIPLAAAGAKAIGMRLAVPIATTAVAAVVVNGLRFSLRLDNDVIEKLFPYVQLAGAAAIAAVLTTMALRSRGTISGLPMRLLALALLLRLATGFGTQVLVVQRMRGPLEELARVFGGAWGIAFANALFTGGVLATYLSLPAYRRTSPIMIALVALGFGVAVDGYATVLGVDFSYVLHRTSRAVFFFDAPSPNSIEALQTKVRACTTATLVLGIVAGVALLAALRSSAQVLESRSFDAIAIGGRLRRAMVLVIVTGLFAIGLGFAIGAVRDKITITAMMLVVAALALGLLVDWTRSLFGLARILDEVS